MARAPLVCSFLAALALAPGAGAAASMRFSSAPAKLWQDKEAAVVIAVRPAGVRCSLTVRYADGSTQKGLPLVRAAAGKARWSWKVPVTADAGAAKLIAWCRGVGKLTRTVVVVGGTQVRAKVRVRDSGWTQRNSRFGTGSSVSYGIVLENPDLDYDAVSIGLLVNLVNAEGRVIASKTERVAGVAAGSEYALGGSLQMPNQIPVARLELVITSSSRSTRALHFPATMAIGFEQATYDPGFLTAIAGELVNGHPRLTLSRAKLSIVVRSPEGTIVGGTTAYVSVPLLPGTRVLWKAQTGLTSIPIDRAASAQISIEPTWVAP
ncbi:MAG: hypothetical protein WD067_06645 [Gaiellaceae bacterium]